MASQLSRIVLLAPDAALADALQTALRSRADLDIQVERYEGSIAGTVDRARLAHGTVPLGIATHTEAQALEALEHGADEALVVSADAPRGLLELADRTWTRGSLRAQREQARVSIAHTEKLAALGTLVAGVAHEINSPLAAIMLALDSLPAGIEGAGAAIDELREARVASRGLDRDEVVRIAALAEAFGSTSDAIEMVHEMRQAAQAIADVVRDLRVFSRAEDDERPQLLEVWPVIEQVLRMAGRDLERVAIVERDGDPDMPTLLLPRARLVQVLTNVLVNALHAIREVQRPIHRVRITTRADDDAVAISISDTGPGIPAEALERIFDPFFTTKRASLGTGLGLSISRSLMRRMGGDLVVESVYGAGATFVMLIPRPSDAALREARRREGIVPTTTTRGARRSVLVVAEDDHLVRAYSRVLARHHDVLIASDAQEAIALVSSGSRADVLVLDTQIPRADAEELSAWLVAQRPELARRAVVIAESEADAARCALASPHVLVRPAPASALVAIIERAAG